MSQYTQTSTSLGVLSTATAGSWVPVPKGANNRPDSAGPIVSLVSTSVTTGGVVTIEGRMNGQAGATAAKELHRIPVSAAGTVIVPLKDMLDNGVMPDEVRINVVSRTDGTYTGALLTAA